MSANLIDVRSLMERAQDGDPQAFRELHDRYAAPVRRFVASRVPDSLADDLTNETFLRAWRALTGFRWQDRDPLAWLLTIARNLIADHWSLLRNRLEVPSDDISPSLHSSASRSWMSRSLPGWVSVSHSCSSGATLSARPSADVAE